MATTTISFQHRTRSFSQNKGTKNKGILIGKEKMKMSLLTLNSNLKYREFYILHTNVVKLINSVKLQNTKLPYKKQL